MYRTYNARPLPQPKSKRRTIIVPVITALLVLLALAYPAYALLRPLPAPRTVIIPPIEPALIKVNNPWPTMGQAAMGADGYGVLATSAGNSTAGGVKPAPIASLTKTVTALAVLSKKPLKTGEPGPQIALTARDEQLYQDYIAKDGAALPVQAGGNMNQYQALQALMLPSANNIADSLAIWAFGSLEAYVNYAQTYVRQLGMSQTTITDASGFAATTVSTPHDLVLLGDAALDNPVLAEIVSQSAATFPDYGPIRNVNTLLGQFGIRGIKTGTTPEAGGCYLAAADIIVNGRKVTVITAVIGATNRAQAMRSSLPLIQSAPAQFRTVRLASAGQPIGYAASAWGKRTPIAAATDVNVLAWTGTSLAPKITRQTVPADAKAGSKAGQLSLKFNGKIYQTDLQVAGPIAKPDIWWRLKHPL